MNAWSYLTASFALLALAACDAANEQTRTSNTEDQHASKLDRGRYLATIMDCAGCHNVGSFSPTPEKGPLQGGIVGIEVPGMGVFYPPNLTSDREAGLGSWTEEQIAKAVRTGERPDGRILSPAMPWRAYSGLTDQDAAALAAYLKSLPPSPNKVPSPTSPERAPQPYLTVKMPAASNP
jgi:cytochrome c553